MRRPAYMTRYCMTTGIEFVEVESCIGWDGGERWIIVGKGYANLKFGEDLHDTIAQAEDRVREVCNARIVSLKKQIDKVEKIRKYPKRAKGFELLENDKPF